MNIDLSTEEALKIALTLHQANHPDDAELLYRRVLVMEPGNLNGLHYLAMLCHQGSRNEEALALIGKILAIDPKNVDANNNMGNVLEALGRFPEAEEYYRKALAINPDHAPALNNLAVMFMSQQRMAEAVAYYQRSIQLNPQIADFRYNLGNALRKLGRLDEAVKAYRDALGLNLNHEGAWRGLAHSYLKAGKQAEAAHAFDQWLRLDPGNELALYMRAACLGEGAPERAPDKYLCQVFDGLANRFDSHLVENLNYRAPQLVVEALQAQLAPAAADLDILDAGCGTGLCGLLLKPHARRLTGVDLSRGMLEVAKQRDVYDELAAAELTQFLSDARGAYDVIASADTLCYFGPLEGFLVAAAGALKKGGHLAFTLEAAGDDGPDWQLNATARYSHRKGYVQEALHKAGFEVCSLSSAVLRNENQIPVDGHVVTAIMKSV